MNSLKFTHWVANSHCVYYKGGESRNPDEKETHNEKARQISDLITSDQMEELKKKVYKGGRK